METDFNFMFDGRLQAVVQRDYSELQQLQPEIHSKSAMVVSGSIIEGLLCDALIAAGEWDFRTASNQVLNSMIDPAVATGILREGYLSHVTRSYRNLIHPGKEVRENVLFDMSDATVAKHAVDIIIRDVSTWTAKFRQEKQWTDRLSSASEDEREFLRLFATPPPNNSPYDHEWLSPETYGARAQLIIDGILVPKQQVGSTQEIQLRPELAAIYDNVFASTPHVRDSVKLDLANIEAGTGGGSGGSARQGVVRR